jgi:hypothetical protein
MAGTTRERVGSTPPASWGDAPVRTGRHRRRALWVLPAVLLAVLVAGAWTLLGNPVPGQPGMTPLARAPTSTFDVTVRVADVAAMDEDPVLGRTPPAADRAAVRAAAQDVATVVRTYLDGMFVSAQTRLTAQPLPGLLSRSALTVIDPADRAGLGAVGGSLRRIEPEPVTIVARVVTDGGAPMLIDARWVARATLETGEGATGPLQQQARMVFVRTGGGWRADVVDATLRLPDTAREADR